MNDLPLERVIDFHKLLLDFRAMDRIIWLRHHGEERQENNVEHSYALAMLAWFVAQAQPRLDLNKVIRYSLVHDLVEVHAGDVFFHRDEAAEAEKHDKEAAALERLAEEWPDFPALTGSIRDYEKRADPESRFVYALDKLQPIIVNYLEDGLAWKKEGIGLATLRAGKDQKVKGSAEVEAYYLELIGILEAGGDYFPAAASGAIT